MAAPFDPSLYVRAPIVTVSTGVTLAFALFDACPTPAPANVKKAAKHLKAVAVQAQADLADRNRRQGVYSDEDSRVLDNEADRAWGGLRMRLQALAMLNAEKFPRARRAAELEASLFAEGTEFLKAEYPSQSTSMGSILKRIDDDGLDKDLDDIAGKEFLQSIRDVQPRYEAMVKERLRRDKDTGQNLADSVRSIQAAIVNYASKIIGTIEHDDPDTTEAARERCCQLRTTARHRRAVRRRAACPPIPWSSRARASRSRPELAKGVQTRPVEVDRAGRHGLNQPDRGDRSSRRGFQPWAATFFQVLEAVETTSGTFRKVENWFSRPNIVAFARSIRLSIDR
jgi:hypothetical protein